MSPLISRVSSPTKPITKRNTPDPLCPCIRINEEGFSQSFGSLISSTLFDSLPISQPVALNFRTGQVLFQKNVGVEVESSNEEKAAVVALEGGPVVEPYVGMEFDSEDEARKFYVDYARRVGFVVRIMQRRRSGIDGRTLARRLGCNKQGFSPGHRSANVMGQDKKARPSAREGCKATILFKMEKSGKWVVSRFEKDHNHPLVVTANGFSTADDKDKKIEELTRELERQDQLCSIYREKLLSFMNNVEEQTEELSSMIQVIVDNVRKVESEMQKSSFHR